MRLSEILPRLNNVQRCGAGWRASCPAHADAHPSLSLDERDGCLLVKCHAGCTFEDIVRALGGGPGDSVPDQMGEIDPLGRNKGGSRRLVSRQQEREYDYTDEHGRLLYKTVRYRLLYDDGTESKQFTAKRPGDPSQDEPEWVHNLKGVPLVLYRLPEVAAADLVYVVEGEKDVETLRGLGLTATCNAFGAGKWRAEYNEPLRGKTVVILPDNDEPGRKHAAAVANALHGAAREVLVIDLPGLEEKGDVTDFVLAGGTEDDLIGLIERAETWSPGDGTATPVGPSKGKFRFKSVRELLQEPEEQTSFIWDLTLPSGGLSIISAKPKVGKSTLARNLAVAVATGQPFLGRATEKSKVLYLCLEEKRSEVRKHFELIGEDTEDVLIHTGSTPEDALVELAVAIAEFGPGLVIIDPLSRVLRVRDFNDYGSMARGFEPLIDLARKMDCHILALHHDSKMDRAGGDALLGSTAIFGAVDCHIQLRKREKGRTVSTTQRYGEDLPETVIELDKTTGRVTAEGDLKSYVLKQASGEIAIAIREGEVLTEKEIKERIEGFSQGDISKALRDMVDRGVLQREGEGKRNKPFLYSKP